MDNSNGCLYHAIALAVVIMVVLVAFVWLIKLALVV